MPRAFTEAKRSEIKEKIMETALELFHDKGVKSLSIGELTKRVGIAQGSFYNFWKDKDSLIIELITYRWLQKLDNIKKEFCNSLEDPAGFLSDIIYSYSMDIMIKIKTQPIYKEAFKIFREKGRDKVNKIENFYAEFLSKLINYWKENSAVKTVNKQGLVNLFTGSFILCSNYGYFDEEYFDEILRIYVDSAVNKYIEGAI